MKFLKDNWLWIVVPIVLTVVAVVIAINVLSTEPDQGFTYPL